MLGTFILKFENNNYKLQYYGGGTLKRSILYKNINYIHRIGIFLKNITKRETYCIC